MRLARRLLVTALLAATFGCAREAAPPQPAAGTAAQPLPPPTDVPSTTGEPSRHATLPLGAEVPQKAAEIALPATTGASVTVAQARREKGLLVVFTCNTCPYARAWEKRLVALGNDSLDQGLGVVFVNSTDPKQSPDDALEAMGKRVEERGHRFPYVADATGALARAFGAARTPEAFVFDATGKLVYHGTVDDNAQDEANVTAYWLKDALQAAVLGRPVPVTETKALGCAIRLAPLL